MTIDGRPQRANALPLDGDGHAYVDLHSPEQSGVEVLLARGLPPGSHDVSITVVDAGEGVAVDGLIVGRSRATPLKPLLAGAIGFGLVATIALITVCKPWHAGVRRRRGSS